MKNRFSIALVVFVASGLLAGCGRSREELERERQRIEAEKQAQRDIQKANKVIGEMGKKIGRKVPPLDLGLPPEKKAESAPTAEPARKP
ncbi:MAG: hypothetical protein Q8N18_26015 [Opitutaceae bacterium]|nr:hypothetical protein [Opitutaceae bacterium]